MNFDKYSRSDLNIKAYISVTLIATIAVFGYVTCINGSGLHINSTNYQDSPYQYNPNELEYFDINSYNNTDNVHVMLGLKDNKSNLKIRYMPYNHSIPGAVCWTPVIRNEGENNIGNGLNLKIPINITFLIKGERGNEWVDFKICTDDDIIRKSLVLRSKEWTSENIYLYTSKSINSICLEFIPEKNPIGASVLLSEIEVNYGRNIGAMQKSNNIVISNKRSHLSEGNDLYDKGNYIAANEKYDEAIRQDATDAAAWYNKGNALYKLGRYGDAMESYNLSSAFDPQFAEGTYYKYQRTVKSITDEINEKIDKGNELVRDEAIRLVSRRSGPLSIDQICSIYDSIVGNWTYVSDWRGLEVLQYSNYTLKNGHEVGSSGKGDCDDFAILLASLIESIGGTPRIILAYDPSGSHIYTEVYLGKENDTNLDRMLSWLRLNYNTSEIYTHTDLLSGDVWLNMDWCKDSSGAKHPGGPFYQALNLTPIYVQEDMRRIPLMPIPANGYQLNGHILGIA